MSAGKIDKSPASGPPGGRCENPECPDLLLYGVVGEYGPGVTICPRCGEVLTVLGIETPTQKQSGTALLSQAAVSGSFHYVTSFRDWGPAQLARSFLESCGFNALLLDQNIVALNWTYSQAVFGIKLVVSGSSEKEALALLEQDRSVELLSVPESSLPISPCDRCPQCESEDVAWPALVRRYMALSMMFFGFLLLVPIAKHFQRCRCRSCSHCWIPE